MTDRTTAGTSRLPGFHKLTVDERIERVASFAGLTVEQRAQIAAPANIDVELGDHMIENFVTTIAIPVGIATNLRVDGREVLVPMATEESSVVAAVGNSARQCLGTGGFTTSMSGSEMIAQIQLTDVPDPHRARMLILERRDAIARVCDACDPTLVRLGGGFRDLSVRIVDTPAGAMVVTHIVVDTRDAMGANAVNTMAERLAPDIARWTGGRVLLRILSNLADRRVARARATWPCDAIGGAGVRDAMVAAYQFADHDPYRAATHNKGIMNGVSAVVLATGNDTRAVEAGAHAFAARTGRYRSLTSWEVTADGDLAGAIELPLAVGLVGGAVKIHPTARALLAIMQVASAQELARIIAAVGLAQNFGAMKALATVGIQQGHMTLHAQNVAFAAGAVGAEVAAVASRIVADRTITEDAARSVLATLRAAG